VIRVLLMQMEQLFKKLLWIRLCLMFMHLICLTCRTSDIGTTLMLSF